MALETLYINGVAGQTYVEDSRLAYAEVMLVAREGKPLFETSDAPEGKEFKHNGTAARVELDPNIPIGQVYDNTVFVADPADSFRPEKFIIQIKS